MRNRDRQRCIDEEGYPKSNKNSPMMHAAIRIPHSSIRNPQSAIRNPLPGGFVQDDAGGDGGVERFNVPLLGNSDQMIAAIPESFRDTHRFVADDYGNRSAEIEFLQRQGCRLMSGDDLRSVFLQTNDE